MGRKPDPEHVRAAKKRPPKIPLDERLAHDVERPLPPQFVLDDAVATECWDRMAALLEKAKLLVAVSRDKLARYCISWSEYTSVIQNMATVRKSELNGRSKGTLSRDWLKQIQLAEIKYSRWFRTRQAAEKEMDEFEKEYGLTPASATKIRMPPGQGGQKEEFDKFLTA
jgi:P27 family predicted phage terminase small subunit